MIDQLRVHIQATTREIIKHYKPEKIILFGSAARGEATDDSDLDFLIIKNDVPHRGIDRYSELLGCINYRHASDFLICKPDEISRRLAMGDPFIKQIITEGKVLYGV